MLLAGVWGFAVHSLVLKPALGASGQQGLTLPAELGPIVGRIFEHYGVLMLLQMALAIFVLFSAVMFLRLRPWARVSLEVVSWFGLLSILALGGLWISTWMRMVPAELPGNVAPIPGDSFRTLGAVMGSGVFLVFAVLCAAILYFLRSQRTRNAFIGSGRPGGWPAARRSRKTRAEAE
jgi:hypothetical protein